MSQRHLQLAYQQYAGVFRLDQYDLPARAVPECCPKTKKQKMQLGGHWLVANHVAEHWTW
ncbi:unnamed protein product [Fusarium graminearum]|nr:unnamed protein product [Fusarium graminearum]CAG1960044.1 unnamed protein product [Fusarium graminearum]VTO84344.1 unnamed protein product [Fusarium graminearum]